MFMENKKTYFIRNAKIVNEGEIFEGSVLVRNEIIEKIYNSDDEPNSLPENCIEIDATGKHLIPGWRIIHSIWVPLTII